MLPGRDRIATASHPNPQPASAQASALATRKNQQQGDQRSRHRHPGPSRHTRALGINSALFRAAATLPVRLAKRVGGTPRGGGAPRPGRHGRFCRAGRACAGAGQFPNRRRGRAPATTLGSCVPQRGVFLSSQRAIVSLTMADDRAVLRARWAGSYRLERPTEAAGATAARARVALACAPIWLSCCAVFSADSALAAASNRGRDSLSSNAAVYASP